jgi:hypothetical protein
MVPFWILIGLVISAIAVSILGALFSVLGLRDLFSGAPYSVMAMGAGLEFGKFVLAAFLHERWNQTRWFMKSYMIFAVITLSVITSMGIFGYLSNAYQTSAVQLEAEELKITNLKERQKRIEEEIVRINATVDEIPDSRISKKMAARSAAEPRIAALNEQSNKVFEEIAQAGQGILKVQTKVGPLIYVARMFDQEIDTVVKYLIIVFVSVFDPLAICLVIALTASLKTRRELSASHISTDAIRPQSVQKPSLSEDEKPAMAPLTKGLASANEPEEPLVEMRYVEESSTSTAKDEDRQTS